MQEGQVGAALQEKTHLYEWEAAKCALLLPAHRDESIGLPPPHSSLLLLLDSKVKEVETILKPVSSARMQTGPSQVGQGIAA